MSATPEANLPPVSTTTPVANFATGTAGVDDTAVNNAGAN